MSKIDVFYQGGELPEMGHISVEADATVGAVRQHLIEKHALPKDCLLFLEDRDEPLDEESPIEEESHANGLRLHIGRCRKVSVEVSFNCDTVRRRFSPAATVARVKRWAARREFGMSEEEASEHVLQIAGTHERPAPSTHIGALTACKDCEVAFDLVPNERVNGAVGQ